MRSFLLSSFSRRLAASAFVLFALMVLFFAVKMYGDYLSWQDAVTEYKSWVTGEGPRCEKLFSSAKEILTTMGQCSVNPDRPESYFQCRDAEGKHKAVVLASIRESGCPTNEYSALLSGSEIPLLAGAYDPGPFFEYVKGRSGPHIAELLVYIVTGIAFLLLLSDMGKRFVLEHHTGWKRLIVLMSPIAALVSFIGYAVESYDPFPNAFLVALFALLISVALLVYGRAAFLWVREGFASAEAKTETVPVLANPIGQASSIDAPSAMSSTAVEAPIRPAVETEGKLVAATYWPRLWARCVDLPVAWILGSSLGVFLPDFRFILPGVGGILLDAVAGMTLICIAILGYEIFFLSRFGATPGKMLFGLVVRSVDNRLPTMEEAKTRAWGYLKSGLYFTIFLPYMQLLGAIFAWQKRNDSQPWDMAARTLPLQRPIGAFRFAVAGVFAFLVFATTVVTHQTLKQLTKEEIRQSVLR